ncbi:hypothetical protein AQI95_02500 [Streptomyces yokosukanensis]|uniref:RCK N-terminal domain-containing protein n=2 Tax=Streptomyces yokosukanensis TaxID=67386 RepID=A0A117Q5D6_9ACTN|nr:hypothetical protein AQI95_02500 [Streptomyces yokosukanensis]
MVICGDDGLAHRLALELDAVCGEVVTVVVPTRDDAYGAGIAALLGVMPVERGSLLFTCVDVAGRPELEGRAGDRVVLATTRRD